MNKQLITSIVILTLIFILALAIRLEPAKYGDLDEFDPFWNYKATKYLVENGWMEYKNWHDYTSWYPEGRPVAYTSQEALHLTTAFLFNFYKGDLYTFTILVPAFFGALSVFPLFVLILKISRSYPASLIGAFFFSVTFSILLRNTAGWFKSEPLGLLLGLVFLAGASIVLLDKERFTTKTLVTSTLTGMVMTFAVSSWTGTTTMVLPILLFGILASIFIKETKYYGKTIVIMGIASLAPLAIFERTASLFIPVALGIIGIGIFLLFQHEIKQKIKLILIAVIITSSFVGLLSSDISDRYKATIFPFLESEDPLVNSVGEHGIPTVEQLIYLQGFYIFLAPIGFILYFKYGKNKNIDKIWLGSILIILMYFGLSLIRLQIVFSIAMIIISAIGTVMIIDELRKSKKNPKLVSLGFVIVLIFTITPMTLMWIESSDTPPMIHVGASPFTKTTNEWLLATDYIKTLEPDAKIFAWWDYGYWITVLGERTTYMDNATLFSHKINEYAEIFSSHPTDAHKKLVEIDADYVLVYSVSTKQNGEYKIAYGGDELKSYWIFTLGGTKLSTINNHYFDNTLIGSMIPFRETSTDLILDYEQRYPDLFQRVYVSPSYELDEDGIRYGILIYKVIK